MNFSTTRAVRIRNAGMAAFMLVALGSCRIRGSWSSGSHCWPAPLRPRLPAGNVHCDPCGAHSRDVLQHAPRRRNRRGAVRRLHRQAPPARPAPRHATGALLLGDATATAFVIPALTALEPAERLPYVFWSIILLTVALLYGELRRRTEETAEKDLARQREQFERDAQQQRAHLSREIHDIVTRSLTVIVAQADGALCRHPGGEGRGAAHHRQRRPRLTAPDARRGGAAPRR